MLSADLEEAVSAEDYRAAAAIKKQQTALEEADCLGAALDALDLAVAEQRFAGGWVAAGLLDCWAAGLCVALLVCWPAFTRLYWMQAVLD